MTNLVHLERNLGPVQSGWTQDADGRAMLFRLPDSRRRSFLASRLGLEIHVEVVASDAGGQKVCLMPVGRLLPSRHARVADQFGQGLLRSVS